MDIKVKAFSEYERYKQGHVGKPFTPMGDADWFVAGFLSASSIASNSEYISTTPQACTRKDGIKKQCHAYNNGKCMNGMVCE